MGERDWKHLVNLYLLCYLLIHRITNYKLPDEGALLGNSAGTIVSKIASAGWSSVYLSWMPEATALCSENSI